MEDESVRDALYIAMAGTHQIWVLYLRDSTWLKGGSVYMSINKHMLTHINLYVILYAKSEIMNRLNFNKSMSSLLIYTEWTRKL